MHAPAICALVMAMLVACSERQNEHGTSRDRRPSAVPEKVAKPAQRPAHDEAPPDASVAPSAFVPRAALGIIRARSTQSSPKMKLTPEAAAAAVRYVREHLTRSAALRRLHRSMPHTTVELARAIGERGVPAREADRIARYLVHLVETLDFARLRRFDINHSHVTGRAWHEIDYTGENMTWQSQKRFWTKKGVISFKRAEYIHAYMKLAYRMPHFAKVYAPRKSFEAVQPPSGVTASE